MEELRVYEGVVHGLAIPAEAVFSARVRGNFFLHIEVGGLSDAFVFANSRYSEAGTVLIDQLDRIVESYNWTNSSDPGDRRFVFLVYLLAEADYRSIFWTPGTVRAF